jgi:protein TonB
MLPKKNLKFDTRKLQFVFFEVGLILAVGLVLAAFQWGISDKPLSVLNGTLAEPMPFDLPPITGMQKPEPPPPPKPKPAAELEIVKNTDPEPIKGPEINSEGNNIPVAIIPIDDEPLEKEPDFVYIPEEMPEFVGGQAALMKYLSSNIVYPEMARDNHITGRVYIQFFVGKDGAIYGAKVLKGPDPLLNAEALRVVLQMPKWKPGYQNAKPVNVCYTVPINFRLN